MRALSDAALSLQRQVLCYSKDARTSTTWRMLPKRARRLPQWMHQLRLLLRLSRLPAVALLLPLCAPRNCFLLRFQTSQLRLRLSFTFSWSKSSKSLEAVSLSETIKDLVGGKSTVQNEILGDLGKEFGSTPKARRHPLEELAESFQDTFTGTLQDIVLIDYRLMSSWKMPGGFSITVARNISRPAMAWVPGGRTSCCHCR